MISSRVPRIRGLDRGTEGYSRSTSRQNRGGRVHLVGSQAEAGDQGLGKGRSSGNESTVAGVSFNSFSRARVLPRKFCPGESRTVPLLDPLCIGGCSAGVPFVTEVELHSEGSHPAATEMHVDEDVYELRFVLHGRGVLCYRNGSKEGERRREVMVEAGDAILMRHGVAHLEGIRGPDDDLCSMATFATYIPRQLLDRDTAESFRPRDFSGFGGRHLWNDRDVDEPSWKMSDLVDKKVLDALLSGATLWMERAGTNEMKSVDLTSDGLSIEAVQSENSGSGGLFESVDDVEPSFATPDSTIAQDIDSKDVYHKQITSSMTYKLPNQTNRLALMFDPLADTPVPFVFGVEIFEPGHRTQPHVHETAFEVFFILSGEGEGFCNGERFPLTAGDVVAFHPGSEHGIDNGENCKMYCIEMMMPDEEFAQFVRGGRLDGLQRDELCILRRVGCK